ncbi:hypothetical protein [Streptomyces sp. NPDC054854]
MRAFVRFPTLLAGLVLAAGGVFMASPAVSADAQACEQRVTKSNQSVTDAVRQACYQGQIGNQTSCTASLNEAGISKSDADQACRVAPQ